jgi:hypothetical protein
MQAQDVLPDDVDHGQFNGVTVRKGTVGAFLANARMWLDPATTEEARAAVARDMIAAIPALTALGLFEMLAIRDDRLRALLAPPL